MPREPNVRGKWITASEYRRRQMLSEIDEEVQVEKEPERARLERPPANGPYDGPVRVRVLPPGVGSHTIDLPGRLGVRRASFTRSGRG